MIRRMRPHWCSELGRPVSRGMCPRWVSCPHPESCQAPPPPEPLTKAKRKYTRKAKPETLAEVLDSAAAIEVLAETARKAKPVEVLIGMETMAAIEDAETELLATSDGQEPQPDPVG